MVAEAPGEDGTGTTNRPLTRLRAALGSVRVRTTLGAVLVVALALVVGAIGLVQSMRRTLDREVRDAARLRALDVATALEAGTPPQEVTVEGVEDSFIQIQSGSGSVIGSTHDSDIDGEPPVIQLDPGESAEVALPFDDDAFLAVAEAAETSEGRLTVIVARTLETVGESTQVVTDLLIAGLPLLLLLVVVTTWKVVGRALAPVEAVRREVEAISATELHRRVPGPADGDEIARLARTMNRMLDRLEQAQRRQRQFVADASHELRSPVASIRQHAEVALAYPERTQLDDLAETVLAEDLRVQRLVEDLLLLARADEQSLTLEQRPVDLDDLVFEEASRLRAGGASWSMQVDTSDVSAARVVGDVTALRRVLRNLADNAARHARQRMAFSLAERDGEVRLDVDDDGPGVPDDDRERVFGRFVRLDEARARDDGSGPGTGLGLSIVAELVAAHGGTVVVDDSPLGGARFQIRLPS